MKEYVFGWLSKINHMKIFSSQKRCCQEVILCNYCCFICVGRCYQHCNTRVITDNTTAGSTKYSTISTDNGDITNATNVIRASNNNTITAIIASNIADNISTTNNNISANNIRASNIMITTANDNTAGNTISDNSICPDSRSST